MDSSFRLPSFAKINLWLKILGKRPDGFHEVETVLQTIDLCDWLSFECSDGDLIDLTTTGRAVPSTPENLVYQAAERFRRKSNIRQGIRIRLEKRLPIGAGLGGGSGNAAMTLIGLNHIFDNPLTFEELDEIAAGLGSDIPFFLHGGMAYASGRGERIVPILNFKPRMRPLIIFPGFEIRTKAVYSLLKAPSITPLSLTAKELESRIRRFRDLFERERWNSLSNDLQKPVFENHPELEDLKDRLEELGFDLVMLSGSGSCLFCVGDESCYSEARRYIESRKFGEYHETSLLDSKDYSEALMSAGIRKDFLPGWREITG